FPSPAPSPFPHSIELGLCPPPPPQPTSGGHDGATRSPLISPLSGGRDEAAAHGEPTGDGDGRQATAQGATACPSPPLPPADATRRRRMESRPVTATGGKPRCIGRRRGRAGVPRRGGQQAEGTDGHAATGGGTLALGADGGSVPPAAAAILVEGSLASNPVARCGHPPPPPPPLPVVAPNPAPLGTVARHLPVPFHNGQIRRRKQTSPPLQAPLLHAPPMQDCRGRAGICGACGGASIQGGCVVGHAALLTASDLMP
ncbi:unnamed protein product, partial [Urochloa humidicola]